MQLGKRVASDLLRQAKTLFKDILAIEDELILVDARKENSEGFESLKNVLKKRREEIIVSIVIQVYRYNVLKLVHCNLTSPIKTKLFHLILLYHILPEH